MCNIDFYNIPIFIVSYNRLDDIKKILARLEHDGYKNIQIIDNASTDSNLLEYLKQLPYKVHFMDQNYGPYVLFKSHMFDNVISSSYYVLTDPDIIPVDDCPGNYVEHFYNILNEHPDKLKVGFSLKIDDLPDSYLYKYDILRFESFYWERQIASNNYVAYDAALDTTFALYRPGLITDRNVFYSGIRTGYPYTARHLGWYVDEGDMTATQKAYYLTQNNGSTAHDISAMQNYAYRVIEKLTNQYNMNIYTVGKKLASFEYMQNISFGSIFKAFFYVLIKKTVSLFKHKNNKLKF